MGRWLWVLCAGVSIAWSTTASALVTLGKITPNPSTVARGVQVVGNLAYVADDSKGLRVIDVSDPTAR